MAFYLKFILQRATGVFSILFLSLLFWGPIHIPITFSFIYTLLHILFLINNSRTAYSTFHTLSNSIKQFSSPPSTSISLSHVIIIPNYKEGMDTLCESLDVLASHSAASLQYHVILAMEASELESLVKAKSLIRMYSDHFFKITFSIHPSNIPNEIRGKSSNVAWASNDYIIRNPMKSSDNVIITVMDADTCFAQDYFTSIAFHYSQATPQERKILMFAPCTVFDRNSNQVPAIVRVADMMWSAGVMSNLYQSSPIKLPCSAYSLTLSLASSVGFWDTNAEAIGEDLHMYLKCFFATKGQVIVKTIFSPASQSNVEGANWWDGIMSRYSQAKRHMWGSLDTGYAIRRTIFGLFAPGYDSGDDGKIIKVPMVDVEKPTGQIFKLPISRLFSLFHRLLEAHIIMAHIVSLIFITTILIPSPSHPNQPSSYIWSLMSSSDPHPYVLAALEVGAWIRFLGIFPFVLTIIFYEKYHHFVGTTRWNLSRTSAKDSESLQSHSLGKRPSLISTRSYWHLLDWITLPLCGPLFLTIPQIQAHLVHLFTDKIEYTVAAKPSVLSRPRPVSEMEMESVSVVIGGEVIYDENHEVKSNISTSSRGDSGYFEFDDNATSSRARTPSPLQNTIWRSGRKDEKVDTSSWNASI